MQKLRFPKQILDFLRLSKKTQSMELVQASIDQSAGKPLQSPEETTTTSMSQPIIITTSNPFPLNPCVLQEHNLLTPLSSSPSTVTIKHSQSNCSLKKANFCKPKRERSKTVWRKPPPDNRLPSDILFEVFTHHLEDDMQSIHSCILVNRLWCQTAVSCYWRNPFRRGKKSAVINTYIACLTEDEIECLMEDGVQFDPPTRDPTFHYAEFLQHLCMKKIFAAVGEWMEYKKVHTGSLATQHHHQSLICRTLCSHLYSQCQTLRSLALDWEYTEKWENYASLVYNPRANIYLSGLHTLKIHQMDDIKLISDLAQLTPYISRLEILDATLQDQQLSPKDQRDFGSLILLPMKLEHLKIFAAGNGPILILHALKSQARSLKHVELVHWKFNDTKDSYLAVEALAACKNLETLILKNCHFGSPDIMKPLSIATFHKLTKLFFIDLMTNEADVFIELIKNNGTTLKEICYNDSVSRYTVVPVLETVITYSSNIIALGVPYRNAQQKGTLTNLLKTIRLKKLKIYGPYGDDDAEFIQFLPEFAELLPESLEELNLDLVWIEPKDLQEFFKRTKARLNVFFVSGWNQWFDVKIFNSIYENIRCDNKVIGDVMREIFV